MEVLLGDLSEIKAENGLIDNQDNFQTMLEPYQPKQSSSSVHFNVIEGHSSVNEEEDACLVAEEEAENSEIAYENIEQLIEVDEDSSLPDR